MRNTRLERKMSVTQLAAACKLARSTVNRIESGSSLPSQETLGAIASALAVPVAELTKPCEARPRVAKSVSKREPAPAPAEIPFVVAKVLCTGRLGKVSQKELRRLIKNATSPEFGGDAGLLELELLFRRACAAMHDTSLKEAFDEAFERIRREMSGG